MKYNLEPCPCCGNKTIDEGEEGLYDICKICGWENDPIQRDKPDYKGGANKMSLNEAKQAFKEGKKVE